MLVKAKTFLIFGVLPAAALQSIGAFIYFILLNGTIWAQPAYLIDKIVIVGVLIFWIFRHPPLPKFQLSKSVKDCLIGLSAGLIATTLIGLVAWINWETLLTAAPAINNRISNFSFLANYFAATAIIFSIFHSLFEEWYWRWFVGKGLELSLKPITAAILGSLAFTAHHVIILSQFFAWPLTIFFSFGVFLAGVIWSTLYAKTKNLTASWISHAMVDLIIFAIISRLI